MEWGAKENHAAVFALHNCGKSYSQIFKLLKPLKISQMFIYRAIKHYEELLRVEDRTQSGHLKSLRAQDNIKTGQELIRQNLLWKQEIMSRELKILTQSMSCLIRDDQHMRVCRCAMGHILTPTMKTIRQTRGEHLLHWQAENGHKNILFTDEKIFTIEEKYNHQNNKIYVQTSREVKANVPRVQGGHHPSYIMVW